MTAMGQAGPESAPRARFQFTTVDLSGAPIRYARITLTAADPANWWSVADVRAYTRQSGH